MWVSWEWEPSRLRVKITEQDSRRHSERTKMSRHESERGSVTKVKCNQSKCQTEQISSWHMATSECRKSNQHNARMENKLNSALGSSFWETAVAAVKQLFTDEAYLTNEDRAKTSGSGEGKETKPGNWQRKLQRPETLMARAGRGCVPKTHRRLCKAPRR